MEPEWEPAREPAALKAWSEILRPLADELAGAARELSIDAVADMRSKLPELFADADSVEGTRASTEAIIRAVATMLARGTDPAGAALPPETIAEAQSRMRRGVAVAPLLRNYRLGHELIWRWLFAQISARATDAAQLAAAAELGSAWLFAYADTAATVGEQFYSTERERWLRSAAASRAETIEAILSGEERDQSRASGRLRYELGRNHLGVIAWAETATEGVDPHAPLEAALEQLSAAISAEGLLLHPIGQLTSAAWLSRNAPFDAESLEAVRLDTRLAPGARVAVGEPATGIAGFRHTHVEAVHARRVAVLSRRPVGSVTRYARAALSAMATVDQEQAKVFVERALGELGRDDDLARRLAATVSVYLEENASRSRAAKRLGIHENTISYRVRQAEEILGHSLETRTLELRVALMLLPAVRGAAD